MVLGTNFERLESILCWGDVLSLGNMILRALIHVCSKMLLVKTHLNKNVP